MAEKYHSFSPYVYCINNPLRFIDPDGKKIRGFNGYNSNNEPIYDKKISAGAKEIIDAVSITKGGRDDIMTMYDFKDNIDLVYIEGPLYSELFGDDDKWYLTQVKGEVINEYSIYLSYSDIVEPKVGEKLNNVIYFDNFDRSYNYGKNRKSKFPWLSSGMNRDESSKNSFNSFLTKAPKPKTKRAVLSALLAHELQHLIQRRNGVAISEEEAYQAESNRLWELYNLLPDEMEKPKQ